MACNPFIILNVKEGNMLKEKLKDKLLQKGENWLNSLGLPKHSLQSR
jgi:hypothetical protein